MEPFNSEGRDELIEVLVRMSDGRTVDIGSESGWEKVEQAVEEVDLRVCELNG